MEVAGPLGTPLGLAQRKRASPRGEGASPSASQLLAFSPGKEQAAGVWDRGRLACGTTHVAHLEFPRETSIILWCAGKAGNDFAPGPVQLRMLTAGLFNEH